MKKYRLAFWKGCMIQFKYGILLLSCIMSYQVTAQIATYSFGSSSGSEPTFPADAQPSNASISVMTRGPGITARNFAGGFNARRWPVGGSLGTNDYYEFTLTPDCDFSITLTSLVLDERYDDINADDTYNWVVRSSLDNYSSDIAAPFIVNATTAVEPGTTTGNIIDLTGGTFDNLAQAVTFRLYAYSMQRDDAEWGIDNVILNGSIDALTDLHTVNFEIDNCGYEAVNASRDSNNEYFLRFNRDNEASGPLSANHDFANVPITNIQGDYYWALEQNQDLDASPSQAGQVIFPPVASPLDVTLLDNLSVTFLIGAPGNNDEYNSNDSLAVQYTYNGGTDYTTIGAFYGASNSPFYQDTDLDGSANVSGANQLDRNLREFTFNIPKFGLNLNLRVVAYTTAAGEEIVFDNIRVQGDPDNIAPIVSAPTNSPQVLREGATSTSTVATNEPSDIYLVLTGQPASTLTQLQDAVTNNNGFVGQVNAVANTAYTVTLPASLNDGVYDIVAIDPAGNVSTILPGWLTVDNTAPAIPSSLDLDASDDTGSSNTDNITQATTGLTITGNGENGSSITLTSRVDGSLTGSATVSSGSWSIDVDLSDNQSHSITAVATDAAGNTSIASAPIVIITDNTIAPPGTPSLDNADDTGASDTDNVTMTLTGLTLSGSGEENAVVNLSSDIDGALGSTTVSGGTWSLDISLSDNDVHTITAIQQDPAGNTSLASASLVITTDNIAPAIPSISGLDNADDTGFSDTDNITQTTSGLTIDGGGENDSRITLSSDIDGTLGVQTTVASTSWTLDITLSDNQLHRITAQATDLAGNTSISPTPFEITIDNTPPAAPALLDLDNADDTGVSSIDNITQTTSGLTISGNGENGTRVALSSTIDGSLPGFNTVAVNSWTLDIALSDNAEHSITAIATDAAGNASTPSAPLIIRTDNLPPTIPDNDLVLLLNGTGQETIAFRLDEELGILEGGAATGFSASTGAIASAVYSGKGATNIITLTSVSNGDWTDATTISYTTGNNVTDLAGNEISAIVTQGVSTADVTFDPGDIAFTGYNSDGGALIDNFSFVLLRDAEVGTKIRFTDNGYDGQQGFLRNTERTLVWEATSRIFAGTEIIIDNDESTTAYTVSCTCPETNGLDLSNNGDQILAYQGFSGNPTFISGIHMDGDNINGTTSWTNDPDADNDNSSSLPPGLTNGTTAIALSSPEVDNARYNYSVNTGTVSSLLGALNAAGNWDTDNANRVTLSAGDRYVLPPDVSSLAPADGSTTNASLSNLTITFDDNIVAGTSTGSGDIQLINVTDGNIVVDSYNLGDPEINITGNTVTIDISGLGGLLNGRTYEVDVVEWAFVNADDNHNVAIDGSSEWSFEVDAVAPTVVSINRNPAVPANANFGTSQSSVSYIVTFSEAITSSTLAATDFVTAGAASGGTATINSTITGSGDTYTVTVDNINLLGDLTINFTGAVEDLVGNVGNTTRLGDQSFTIINPEPSQQPTAFNAVPGIDNFTLDVSWTAGAGAQLAQGYLLYIIGPSGSFPANPTDLIAQTDDLDFSDDVGILNVTGATSTSINGLNSATQYNFRLFPFTNSGNQIDYKTDGVILNGNGTTSSAQFTSLSFTGSAPTVSSLTNSPGSAIDNFSFTITDDGTNPTADNAPTLIRQLVINLGTGNDIDWTDALAGVELSDGSNTFNTVTNGGDISISDTQVSFSNIPTGAGQLGEVPDNGSKIFRLRIWLRNPITNATLRNTLDGLNFAFEVNSASISYAAGSSRLAGSQSASSGAANNAVTVVATTLNWEVQPPSTVGVLSTFATAPVVEAVDANGNRDLDYSGLITNLANTGGIAMNNSPAASPNTFNTGIYTFNITPATGFSYGDAGNGTLTLTAVGLTTSPPSNGVTVSYSNGTTISAGPGIEPLILESTQTSITMLTVPSFDFTVTDDASTTIDDRVGTDITQLVISAAGGTNTLTANWADVIQQAQLVEVGSGTPVTQTAISNNSITFDLTASTIGRINDNQSRTYRLFIALRSPMTGGMDNVIDNRFMNFRVTDLQITTAPVSSTLATSQSVLSGATNNRVNVEATQLAFEQQPSNTFVNETMLPTVRVEANDNQGNRDLDYSGNVTVVSDGSLTSAPVTANLTNGTALTTAIIHDAIELNRRLTASEAIPTLTTPSVVSTPFNIIAGINESDIVARPFMYIENIPYVSFTTTPVTASNPKVFEFDIRDGASGGTATDIDSSPTNVTSLEFTVGNIGFLSEIGLFDSGDNSIATGAITGNTVSFDLSGSPLVIPDDDIGTYHLRAVFNTSVIDNQQITFTVTAAQANNEGSTFESADGAPTAGSAATSSIAGDDNRVEVVADRLIFNTIPNATLNTTFLPVIQVNALDALDNRDLDFDEAITSYSNQSTTPAISLATINNPSGSFASGVFQFPANFQFTEAGQGVTITIETPSFDGSPRPAAVSNSFDISSSSSSNITLSSPVTQPARIDYINFLSGNITGAANAFELARFSINDGGNDGGTDMDGANTILNEITFDISNPDNIRRIAIYDGTTEVAEIAGGASSLTFTGLASDLVALDDDSKEFIVYVTFNPANVIDLENHQLIIMNAVESGGSQFEFDQAGITDGNGAQTSTGVNTINVIATQYTFSQQPAAIEGVNVDWSNAPVYPEVTAEDAQGLTDLEINESISSPGTFGITTPPSLSGGASITCSSCAFSNGVMDLSSLRYTSPGDGTLTINDLASRSISSVSSNAVDVINTTATLLTEANGIVIRDELNAGSVNQPIFGFRLISDQDTPGQPVLNAVTLQFINPVGQPIDISPVFENFRLFSSLDGNLDVNFSNTTNITAGITAGTDFVTFTGLNEVLDEDVSNQYFYLVVDLQPGANSSTPSLFVSLEAPGAVISSGSFTTSPGSSLVGKTFTFRDARNPSILSLTPPDNDVTVNTNTQLSITFDEAVRSLDGIITLRKQADPAFIQNIGSPTISADNRTFTFTPPSPLDPEDNYYVNIAAGNLSANTGFLDNSNNPFPGITNTTTWNFRTADLDPPTMSPIAIHDLHDVGFNFSLQINEQGTVYYVVVDHTDPGFDPLDLNTFTEVVNYSIGLAQGSFNVTLPNQDYTIQIGELTPNQDFTVYAIAQDAGNNPMASPVVSNAERTDGSSTNGVVVTGPSVSTCLGESQPLTQPILIREGNDNDFSTVNGPTVTYTIGTTSNAISFDPSKPLTISTPSTSDISNVSYNFLSNNSLRITYDITGTSERDFIRIEGLHLIVNSVGGNSLLERIGGTAVHDGNSETDAQVHADISTTNSSVIADFIFDPEEISFSNQDVVNYDLVPDPSLILGTNVFSGPGVLGNTTDGYQFDPQGASIGVNTIVLSHTDQFGCIATTSRAVTVFDGSDPIDGLADNYCATPDLSTPDNTITIFAGAKAGFTLEELTLDVDGITNPGDISDPNVLVPSGANWDFDINLAGSTLTQDSIVIVRFNAKYRSNFNALDSLLVSKEVFIGETPSVESSILGNAPEIEGEFCEDGSLIQLRGRTTNPGRHPNGSHSFVFSGANGNGLVDNFDGSAEVDPVLRGVGAYEIIYQFTNNTTTCSNTDTLGVTINPKPVALFNNPDNCVDQDYQFNGEGNIDNSIITSATVRDYDWNFDDVDNAGPGNPNTSTEEDPTHIYAQAGTYNVELTVTSNVGCRSDVQEQPVEIGNNPIVDFTFQGVGLGEPTTFTPSVSNIQVGGAGNELAALAWVINGVADTVFTDQATPYNTLFPVLGQHFVELVGVSDKNCVGTERDSLFIVPIEVLDATNTYQADFERGTDDWIAWGTNTSWTVSNSGGTTITSSADLDVNGKTDFWVTSTGDYNPDEISFVYSPIFDITGLDNPLLTLNTFRDALAEDGALVEYSFTGFATNGTSDWQLLGDLDASNGIENWFNRRDIGTFSVANLNDNPRDEGWTESDSLWRNSKQSLTEIKAGGNRFQLRIGFISSSFGDKTDGFAFDNVFIGESTRSVLIENFTNSSQVEGTKNNADILIETYIDGIDDDTDAIVINYHTDFPGIDEINADNPIDPSARALFYGFSSAPSVMIDGQVAQSGSFTEDWLVDQVGFRTLELSPFNIDIDLSTEGGNLMINTQITQLLPDVGNELLVYAAVLEKDVPVSGALPSGETELRFALRKMLPNAAGLPVDIDDIGNPIELTWNPGGDIDPNDMAVVVFVQNENTKEIYQSAIRTSTPVPSDITSLDDLEALSNLVVYPNPANQKVTLHFGEPVRSKVPVMIYDTFGKQVFEGEVNAGSKSMEIETHDFAPGMYHIQLNISDDQGTRKRLMVIHN